MSKSKFLSAKSFFNTLGIQEYLRSGKFFSACFIKRTNNEERIMHARCRVKSHLKGGKLKYNPTERNLLTVFDMQKREYRMINIETIKWIKLAGVTMTFNK